MKLALEYVKGEREWPQPQRAPMVAAPVAPPQPPAPPQAPLRPQLPTPHGNTIIRF